MPRDASGVYTLPPGYEAITGQTIEASQHNPPLEDIAAALTGSLPRNGSAPMLAPLNMAGSRVLNLPEPGATTDPATKAYVDAAIAAVMAAVVAIPPGAIIAFPGDAPPDGWLVCNGTAVSRTTYAALFVAIGTKYGSGDGSTTFNLPEIRGEFLRFADLGRGADPGRGNGTWQGQEIQSHNHNVNDAGHAHSYNDNSTWSSGPNGFSAPVPGPQPSDNLRVTSTSGTGISLQPTGGTETRPRNIAFIGIIKV